MTHASQQVAPLNQPISFTQTQAAEAEVGVTQPADRVFTLGRQSWPLVASVSFRRSANIQKALNEFDLLELAEQLPSLVLPANRQDLQDYLLADTESTDPDHITMPDVIDAWSAVQEIISARPFEK